MFEEVDKLLLGRRHLESLSSADGCEVDVLGVR